MKNVLMNGLQINDDGSRKYEFKDLCPYSSDYEQYYLWDVKLSS